ncbi:helix-turn-helix domain-containing protein [Microbispora hainanensis]|jgi:transcriptional regulator with XRE-family HTH domain|uniref:Helix-turn-helix domain-containing protein n=1 Tax=Microbispora hainanensis TaxID=568844 RepID=A0ABZ1T2R9_9ACTN|nr:MULTISPECIES: helix-turn-helix transcriptional regulator [Microbispora]NJP24905.1 helix-turn-helix domain-containing protein [Microbispora sp. CL1-1]TQS14362.1 helix-turn-helix domain-containing protein [Microbispora sp. SCL1-1]
MRGVGGPTVRLRRLSGELTRLRREAGFAREEVARRLGMAASTVYRIETGHTRPHARTIRDLLDLYAVEGSERDALIALARDAARRGWWRAYDDVLPGPYVGLESEASSVRNYEPLLVPGLLQTEDYARAVIGAALVKDPAEIERRAAARMERQRRLTGPTPLELWAVIDEAALRRPVGGPAVMAEQLRRLQEMAVQPNVTVQVLPFDAGAYLGMGNPTAILAFPDPGDAAVVLLENMSGELYLEDPAEIRGYVQVFDHLRAAALGPEKSMEMINSVEKEMAGR